jgi:hypothetical protein
MPAFEITRIVRASGFDPLAPPLREGTTYVVRATDFRGILMRVVVDARSGAIRAVNRIVSGPGPYGQFGMIMPPYGVAPPYPPPDIAAPNVMPDAETTAAPMLRPPPAPLASSPPLPRPRPAELASRKAADDAKSDAKRDARRDAKSDAVSAPAAATVAPNKPPAPPPMNE